MVQHLNTPALKQHWVLDAQWTDCPLDVYEEIKDLWRYEELGNDKYMWRGSIKDLVNLTDPHGAYTAMVERWVEVPSNASGMGWVEQPLVLDALIMYLRNKGLPEDENIIIHWWW